MLRHSSFNQRAAKAHNTVINAVNYHHSVISSALCGKIINYYVCKIILHRSSSLAITSPIFLSHLFIGGNEISLGDFIRACHFPKSEIYIYSSVLYMKRFRARTGQIYIYLYECLRRHFNLFSISLCRYLFPFFFLFFLRSHRSPLQKRELYRLSNETPDRYRSISCDNSFFYHSGTTAVARVKRSRQHIHAT